MSVFNLRFVPRVVNGAVVQGLTHGRRRSVPFVSAKDAGRMQVLMPAGQRIKIRFVKGGKMYAGLVRGGNITKVQHAKTGRMVDFGYRAPSSKPVSVTTPTLGSLDTAEMARRSQALFASLANAH